MTHKDFSKFLSSNTIYGLPKSHWLKHLHNFNDPPPSPGLLKAVTKFIDEWKSGVIPAPRLVLTGKQGRGKTHVAVGIYRHGIYETDLKECAYVYVPEFCRQVKKGYGDNDDPFLEVEDASLVILDDIFGAELSQHDINNIVTRLITLAYDKNQSLVVTSNYTLKEMSEILHPHEMSRLLQNIISVKMTSEKDKRL